MNLSTCDELFMDAYAVQSGIVEVRKTTGPESTECNVPKFGRDDALEDSLWYWSMCFSFAQSQRSDLTIIYPSVQSF